MNGREYQTDLPYDSEDLAQENAAMRAFMICRNFTVNGGMLARNGIVQQGLPATDSGKHSRPKKSRHHSSSGGHRSHGSNRSGHHDSSSSSHTFDSEDDDDLDHQSVTSIGTSLDFSQTAPESTPKDVPLTQRFEAAVSSQNFNAVTNLLDESFAEIACGNYAWIDELRQLGLSISDIAQELLEEASGSPWIFSTFEVPSAPAFRRLFHAQGCLCPDNPVSHMMGHSTTHPQGPGNHSFPGISDDCDGASNLLKDLMTMGVRERETFQSQDTSTTTADCWRLRPLEGASGFSFEESVKERIYISCGLGGVRPSGHATRALSYGIVEFDAEKSSAVVSYDVFPPEDTLVCVLDSLSVAAGTLQEAGGCCNKFTFLSFQDSTIELHSLSLEVISELKDQIHAPILKTIKKFLPGSALEGNTEAEMPGAELLLSIVVQFLSTAFLSYSQAHCGPLRSGLLDTGVERIMLVGAAEWRPEYDGPCISGSLVDLACFGDMLGEPAMAFRYFNRCSQAQGSAISDKRHDLIADPHSLVDTWGPGQLISTPNDHEVLHAIYLGGGTIRATGQDADRRILHWSREPRLEALPELTFSRTLKSIIGAQVSVNTKCQARKRDCLRSASAFMHELGTYRDYWESAERQLGFGLQAGPNLTASLQVNQTWIKMKGLTKKSRLLVQTFKSDLDELYCVQVSVCTGVARRVSLRTMLANLLPTYVAALVSEPPLWKSLLEDFGIISVLESGDLANWSAKLSYDHQKTFESLLIAILTLMRDTGIDKKGENFVIGCVQPGISFQCFQVPCSKENYWTRMLADSDEVATFAYITIDCLETNHLKCRGPGSSWANSTGLFWTAVACCETQIPPGVVQRTIPWGLQHSEAYIIGTLDAPLLVKVDRPSQIAEPRLLVSISRIQAETLRRLFRKAKIGHTRRLRERRVYDPVAEDVFILVGKSDVSTGTG